MNNDEELKMSMTMTMMMTRLKVKKRKIGLKSPLTDAIAP